MVGEVKPQKSFEQQDPKDARGRREQATASTVLTLSQGACGEVQVNVQTFAYIFNLLLYEKNAHVQQLCNFHYKKEPTNKFTKKRQLMLSSQKSHGLLSEDFIIQTQPNCTFTITSYL